MAVTPRQEEFAQEVANGHSQAEAYRIVFPNSRKWKDQAVHVNASKMMARTNVALRVAELRADLAKKALWTREQSVTLLSEIASAAEKDSDRVSAVKELNAMHGFNAPQKMEHSMAINWPLPQPKVER